MCAPLAFRTQQLLFPCPSSVASLAAAPPKLPRRPHLPGSRFCLNPHALHTAPSLPRCPHRTPWLPRRPHRPPNSHAVHTAAGCAPERSPESPAAAGLNCPQTPAHSTCRPVARREGGGAAGGGALGRRRQRGCVQQAVCSRLSTGMAMDQQCKACVVLWHAGCPGGRSASAADAAQSHMYRTGLRAPHIPTCTAHSLMHRTALSRSAQSMFQS
eukprot:365793-Chlamydomonas_euryale.AAC.2